VPGPSPSSLPTGAGELVGASPDQLRPAVPGAARPGASALREGGGGCRASPPWCRGSMRTWPCAARGIPGQLSMLEKKLPPQQMLSPGRLPGSLGDRAAARSCRFDLVSPLSRRQDFPPSPPSGCLRATTGRRLQPSSWTATPSRLLGAWAPRWARWAASSPPTACGRAPNLAAAASLGSVLHNYLVLSGCRQQTHGWMHPIACSNA